MAYATTTDLANTIPAAALVGVSTATQNAALARVSSKMDGYFASQFSLPLVAPYSDDVVQICCDITTWDLMRRRGFAPGLQQDSVFRQAYEDAISWLEGVSAGIISPPGIVDGTTDNEGLPAVVSGVGGIYVSGSGGVYPSTDGTVSRGI